MLYVLAANILGPRPQAVPKKGSMRPQTYANLRGDLDEFGNALRDVEADVAVRPDAVPDGDGGRQRARWRRVRSLGKALYFCVPRNDKLLELLGHRRRPAVQDPQQPEHPGRLPPAAAVRAADRSGAAGARGRRRPRRRRRSSTASTSRCRSCASSCSRRRRPRSARRSSRSAPACCPRWRRRTARRSRSCARSTSATITGAGRARQVRPAAGGDQGARKACSDRSRSPCSATPTTSGSSARRPTRSPGIPQLDELDTRQRSRR